MSLRIRCRNCQTAFVTSDDQAGQTVTCPKCDTEQRAPAAAPKADADDGPMLSRMKAPSATPEPASGSIFLPKKPKDRREPKPARKGLWAAAVLIPTLAVGVLIAWPAIMRWWDPKPKTMVERAAYEYLEALAQGDAETEKRIGVVEEPPAIRSFRDLKRDKEANIKDDGSFAPIARLHRQIEKKFVYDAATGRFTPKDPLGPAAETLDALHDAKAKADKDGTYTKMASGDPEEAMQAAIDFGGVFTKLSEGILSPRKLIPSYKMLVQNSKPALTGKELALALDYANHREVWDALLKRPFPTLKGDGKFLFEKAEVTASVRNKLDSSGDPLTTVRLRLIRFRTDDGIDTNWRVVAARRVQPGVPFEPEGETEPEPKPTPEPPKPSPGEINTLPGLIPEPTPCR